MVTVPKHSYSKILKNLLIEIENDKSKFTTKELKKNPLNKELRMEPRGRGSFSR